MNKWKIAFWICLSMLIITFTYGAYLVIDLAVTLSYTRASYTDTNNDLEKVMKIFNDTDLSKTKIKESLKNDVLYETMDFNKDTVEAGFMKLVFKDERLIKISK